jgi:hypothetical protein
MEAVQLNENDDPINICYDEPPQGKPCGIFSKSIISAEVRSYRQAAQRLAAVQCAGGTVNTR